MTLGQNIMNTITAGMGYSNNADAAAVDIFQKFNSCKDSNWVAKIAAKDTYRGPIKGMDMSSQMCLEDHMVESLHNNHLIIMDVDGVMHKLGWDDFVDTFATIAQSEYHWVLKDLMSSWDDKAERAADTFVQIWVFGSPVYFG